MDDEVIALAEWNVTEDGLQGAGALRDVDYLVALRVAIEMRVLLVWLDVKHRHIRVEQKGQAVERGTSAALCFRRAKVPVS